jgi:trk system potassium uptake protein TrkH
VGASENYGAVPQGGRWVLSFLMLAGRLEIFTVLVLLTPAFWRPNVA